MNRLNTLPDWLAITGQSGAGKGSVFGIVSRLAHEDGLSPLLMGTGGQIREAISSQTLIARRMQEINDRGLRQPSLISSSLWFINIMQALKEGQKIIQEGSPRDIKEFQNMRSLVDIGYFKSLRILEVCAPDEMCRHRLAERTRKDKRLDLSIDGKPGEPDFKKIDTKLGWWTTDRPEIIGAAKEAGMYMSIANTGTIEELEREISMLFSGL